MKQNLFFKTLLIAIGLLVMSVPQVKAWYSHNNASHIYFNDYNSKWVSDPSSNGIAFLMGRDQTYGGQGIGSQAYRMAHIEHTNLWYCYVAAWGSDGSAESQYEYVAFRFAPGTTGWNDWQGGWDNRVTGRAQYGSNTKYSMTRGDNITGRNQYYCATSSNANTGYDDINNGLRKYTAYLRVNFDEEADGTYDGMFEGDGTWSHGVTFDFTGTYMKDEGSSAQSTIHDLAKNGWTDGTWKWGFADIPITGEVTFELKTIDTGFEIEGWAYSSKATTPDYTAVKNNPTFQVLGSESFYVAMIRRKSYTVTLNDNGGSGGSGSKTVKYDRSANMTTSVAVPSKSGYTFQGYYTENNGTGSQIIDKYGAWIKNVSEYTGTDGSGDAKWVRDGGVTLYAKWTQNITLDRESGTTGSTSVTATYNSATLGSFTNPERTGYTFGGYYSGDNGTNQLIINTSKVLQANKTDGSTYTGAGGKWLHEGATTLYAKWTANEYAVTFDKESGTGGDASVTATYDADMPSAAMPTRSGYNFRGYWDGDDGTGTQYYDDEGSSVRTWDKASATTLHAKWEPKTLIFDASSDGNWNTAGNWTDEFKPTKDHDVTISKPVTVNTNAAKAKSITFSGTGKITIPSDGVLEVAGTIANSIADNIVINTTSSSQGALICDLSSAPAATVNMTLPSSGFHLIASPTGGASVSSSFSGKGIYTWAWEEGKGWDRRGYYEDFTGGEPILLYGQTSCSFSGYLANYCGGSLAYTSTPENEDAKGINMLSNSLTAPILISKMSLSGSYDDKVYLLEDGVWKAYSTGGEGTDVIPALNGYGVVAGSSGSVSVDYATAVRGASNKNAALKAPQRATDDAQDYMTIFVTTNERKIDLILYEDAAKFTDAVDKGYEACYIEGDGRFGQLYAYAERKMTQLAKANLEGTVLGFAPGEIESYTISFAGDGKGYYLNDVVTSKSTLIDENNIYEFTSDENTNDTRFVISKTPISKTPTSVDHITDGVKARKQLIDGTLYIIRDGRIYTATGAAVK